MELPRAAHHERFHTVAPAARSSKLSSSASAPASNASSAASSPLHNDDPQQQQQQQHVLRSVDSTSSLSSTVYEDDDQQQPTAPSHHHHHQQQQHRPGSAPPNLAFESSAFFDFGGQSAFFSHMKYDDDDDDNRSDEFPDAIASPTSNNDILPPHVLSPTNQTSHDARTNSNNNNNSQRNSTSHTKRHPRTAAAAAVSVTTASAGRSHTQNHRKNSIEMFLSQSPSQSLGGDFLKLSLDDHVRSQQQQHRPLTANSASAFASGHFTLDAVTEAAPPPPTTDYRRSSHRLQLPQLATTHSNSAVDTLAPPPLLSRSSSNASSYSNYQLSSPRMGGSESSWHGSQDGNTSSNGPATVVASTPSTGASYYEQHVHADYFHTPAFYSPSPRPQQSHHHSSNRTSQWHPANSSTASPYANSSAARDSSAMYAQPQHLRPYDNNSHHGSMRSGGRTTTSSSSSSSRSQHPSQQQLYTSHNSHSLYHPAFGHRTPPLPETSPPHSPSFRKATSGHLHSNNNTPLKPCKFYLQGHCRMANKCKFAHNTRAFSSQAASSIDGRHSGLVHSSQLSPHPHPHSHQSHSSYSSDDAALVPHHPFLRPTSRNSYARHQHADPLLHSSSSSSSLLAAGHIAPIDAAPTTQLPVVLSVDDIRNRVFAMSKDQNGCRLLQEQLESDDRIELWDVIYSESLDHLAEMMVDPFGNYLFQKLLERGTPAQRLTIIRRVSSNLVAAALNLHGTRSVQKVVEVCATAATALVDVADDDEDDQEDDEHSVGCTVRDVDVNDATNSSSRPRKSARRLPDIIVDALRDDAVRLCIDSNGNHVIQRALQFLPSTHNQFVFDAVCRECTTVGTHRHGCCVLQRCLDAATPAQRAAVIAQVERQAMKLMQDPYGNYVVQYVLDACSIDDALGVMVKPLGSILELSVQKFSSNVIEKCLEKAPAHVREQYVAELIASPKMHKMLQDQFANYVVQRALCVSAESQCLELVQAIRPHLANMKNTSGGRRITARILKRFPTIDLSLEFASDSTGGGGLYAPHAQHLPHQYAPTSRLPPVAAAMGYSPSHHHHQQQQQHAHHYQQQQQHASSQRHMMQHTGQLQQQHPPRMAALHASMAPPAVNPHYSNSSNGHRSHHAYANHHLQQYEQQQHAHEQQQHAHQLSRHHHSSNSAAGTSRA